MRTSATNNQVAGKLWLLLKLRVAHSLSRIGHVGLVLAWIWVALKAAVGDEGAHSEILMSGPLLAVGVLCLAALLLFRGEEAAHVRRRPQLGRQQMRRRTGSRILGDRRRNGVPTFNSSARPPRPLILDRRLKGRTSRPAKIVERQFSGGAQRACRGRIVA